MAQIVAPALVSHAPLVTGRPEVSRPEERERFYAGCRELQRRLARARPDLLVMFVNDRLQDFPHSNMPPSASASPRATTRPAPAERG